MRSKPVPTIPELVAHRGWAARCPDNTLLAIGEALRAGAGAVEIDVQLTRDGLPVLFHDRTLERLCGVKGAIRDHDWSELATFACAEREKFGERFVGERIARLEEFVELLTQHPRAFAFVEVKRAALEHAGIEAVLALVARTLAPLAGRSALISFSLPFLAAARRSGRFPLGSVFDSWEERTQPIVTEIDPEFVFCDVDGLPAAGELVFRRAKTVIYEIADPALARSLAARGVSAVETIEIGAMLAALGPASEPSA